MKPSTRKMLIGAALIAIPGASLAIGVYLIYKGIRDLKSDGKSYSTASFIKKMKEEAEREFGWKNSSPTTQKLED